MKTKLMRQSTVESCLTCCILMEANRIKAKKITREDELNGIMCALKHPARDYLIGHEKWAQKELKIKVKKSLRKNLEIGDIINIDCFYLGTPWHYPHFITIMGETDRYYQIYNPWTGNIHNIKKSLLERARQSLEKYLGFRAIKVKVN